jgi:hypothetical protein
MAPEPSDATLAGFAKPDDPMLANVYANAMDGWHAAGRCLADDQLDTVKRVLVAEATIDTLTARVASLEAERQRLRTTLTDVEDFLLDISPYFTGDAVRRSTALKIIRAALTPTPEEPNG